MGKYTGKFPNLSVTYKTEQGTEETRNYLKISDRGSEVKKVQKFLNWAIGAKLKVDGIFGTETQKAVKNFQNKVGVTANGRFNKPTLKKAKKFVKKTKYTGALPTLDLVKSHSRVIEDTVSWAKLIANDNDFHYGYTNKSKSIDAHHNGCYFCGTNTTKGGRSKKGIVGWEHTYCCNPFVGAAWAHGGCVPEAMELCRKGTSWDFSKGKGYDTSSRFKHLGHPKKSALEPGDVLCRSTHVALYVGDGKIAEAGGGDDNKRNSSKWNNSIRVRTLTNSNYNNFTRVYRFKGSVNTKTALRHGELSGRVKKWNQFLNWYYNGKLGTPTRFFSDATLKYTKKFQKAMGIEATGVVASATIKAAKKVKK